MEAARIDGVVKLFRRISTTKLTLAGVVMVTGALPLLAHVLDLGEIWETVIVALGVAAATSLLWRLDRVESSHGDQLRERRYLRSVIDAIPHFIFARDSAGRFTLVNKAVADFYGRPVEEVEGHHLY